MGDGTERNPFTREDIIDAIARNGGSAWDLDLSESNFEKGVDLRDLDLSGIILNKAALLSAKFDGSKLKGAKFRDAYLQHATFNKYNGKVTLLRDADLSGASLDETDFKNADLQGAKFCTTEESPRTYLFDTDFRSANLFFTRFKECTFYHTKLEGTRLFAADIYDSDLGDADWGNYVIEEENKKSFQTAASIYRHLKVWYTQSGYFGIAAKFYYREKEANRKSLKWYSRHRWTLEFLRWLFAYGEDWKRILVWMAIVISVFAAVYYYWGSFSSSSFWDTLYYSATSFSALGYGQWAPQPTGWAKGIGAAEAIIGVAMMALLLVTFVRKWTR